MNNILDKIIDVKLAEIAAQQRECSLETMRNIAYQQPACRDFYRTLTGDRTHCINVIAEIKKASPSAGLIRADFDPAKLADTYEGCGVNAISVLTDEQFFQGKLEYLALVKNRVSVPVLRKDFIIDPYQVYQSRAGGADAILLIAEALEPQQIAELADLANELGMTVLLEVHELASLEKARAIGDFPRKGDRLLGVNNRNLKTMVVDLATSEQLAAHLGGQEGLVAESGIKRRADVDRLVQAGFSGVLIGETLMRAEDIAGKFAELFD
ncbi:MAG: indole-3-glycerol phosphate synthase TrpC [Sedimentisphaerales bacterium]|nr:indole-3-glycerol phosphate synthase TrpC [Sedimentisphaerales bacterium]